MPPLNETCSFKKKKKKKKKTYLLTHLSFKNFTACDIKDLFPLFLKSPGIQTNKNVMW